MLCSAERDGKTYNEFGSLSNSGAYSLDGSAVQFDKSARYREAQPESALLSHRRHVRLTKFIENVGQEFSGNALAVVLYCDIDG